MTFCALNSNPSATRPPRPKRGELHPQTKKNRSPLRVSFPSAYEIGFNGILFVTTRQKYADVFRRPTKWIFYSTKFRARRSLFYLRNNPRYQLIYRIDGSCYYCGQFVVTEETDICHLLYRRILFAAQMIHTVKPDILYFLRSDV